MAKLSQDSLFQKWDINEEERIQGSILTTLQRQCIQNQITAFAEERIALPFIDENKQRDAELQGSINSLKYLLILSEAAEKELITPQLPDSPTY
jgi:hypothetical protein